MKLHDASSPGYNSFTGYGEGFIAVNGITYRHSLIVTPQRIDDTWGADAQALRPEDMAPLASFAGHVILLGTGSQQHFPSPALLRPLLTAGIAIEIMDSFAACRTYNILAAENRPVVAALLLPGSTA